MGRELPPIAQLVAGALTNVDALITVYIDVPRYKEPDLEALPVACCTPLSTPRISQKEVDATATLFKALADPHRVRIVNVLANANEAVCVCEITPLLGLSQPTTSFHLKKLVASGLITREQRGTWAYYAIDPQAMDRLSSVLDLRQGAFA